MPTITPFDTLAAALRSPDHEAALGASWEAFAAAEQVADAMTWAVGCDELPALAAAESATAGKALLPLPDGPAVQVDAAEPAAEDACADVLDLVARRLQDLADADECQETERETLTAAAEHARRCARSLRLVRATA